MDDFVEFCDEKFFTNYKKCIRIIQEVNFQKLNLNQMNFFEKIKNPQKSKLKNKRKEEKCFRYTTTFINITSLVISIILFLIINFFYSNFEVFSKSATLKAGFIVEENNIISENNPNETKSENKKEELEWYLEIPIINLKAEIAQGTTQEVMNQYIGHFEETQKEEGNVGLAAHNRGYDKNYFQNLKQLKEGDIVIYKHQNFKKSYKIVEHKIIKDTDWTFLENTEDNRITLITCVENQQEYRRCIQAIEQN